jgi:hypothetical protein
MELLELTNNSDNILCGCVMVDVKYLRKLIDDGVYRGCPITALPDPAGGMVELMNNAPLAIEYHRFTLDHTNTEVRPSFRMIIPCWHVWQVTPDEDVSRGPSRKALALYSPFRARSINKFPDSSTRVDVGGQASVSPVGQKIDLHRHRTCEGKPLSYCFAVLSMLIHPSCLRFRRPIQHWGYTCRAAQPHRRSLENGQDTYLHSDT